MPNFELSGRQLGKLTQEGSDPLNDTEGEVGVPLVYGKDLLHHGPDLFQGQPAGQFPGLTKILLCDIEIPIMR